MYFKLGIQQTTFTVFYRFLKDYNTHQQITVWWIKLWNTLNKWTSWRLWFIISAETSQRGYLITFSSVLLNNLYVPHCVTAFTLQWFSWSLLCVSAQKKINHIVSNFCDLDTKRSAFSGNYCFNFWFWYILWFLRFYTINAIFSQIENE